MPNRFAFRSRRSVRRPVAGRLAAAFGLSVLISTSLGAQEPVVNEDSGSDLSVLSPVPFSAESIRRGGVLYRRLCTECHGPDGRARIDVIADATDLTQPELWYSGTAEGEIFRSIRDGTGVSMPPYESHVESEAQIWDLVNFVRSLWPESVRPALVEGEAAQERAPQSSEPPGS